MVIFRKIGLLVISIVLVGNAYCQKAGNMAVTLNLENVTLDSLFNSITSQTGVCFTYSSECISNEHLISVKENGKSIHKLLLDVLPPAGLKHLYIDDHIVIRKEVSENPQHSKTYTISGFVKDAETGEALVGASVVTAELRGTSTNNYGFYSLTLPAGHYSLEYFFLGYRAVKKSFELNKDISVEIEMETDQKLLQEIMISAAEKENVIEKSQMSEIKILPKTIDAMPGMFGEPDIIKNLQSFPGIKNYGDGSVAFYVRGGSRDQNLILIDEAPIYNPAHLLGFFSSIVPSAVKEVKIYKADIPIYYGGRLSSLISITTKEGNNKNLEVGGSLGLIASNLTIEGPIKKERSSFFLSARRSHLEYLFKPLLPGMKMNFYDLNAKANTRIGRKDKVFVSYYMGSDYFGGNGASAGTFGIGWGNMAGTIRWNHVFSEKLFLNTTLYGSRYDYNLYTSSDREEGWNTFVGNGTGKFDFSYYITPEHTFRFGIHADRQFFNQGNLELKDTLLSKYIPWLPILNTQSFTPYAGFESKFGKLSCKYGFRIPSWQNIGPATYYGYDNYHRPIDTTEILDNKIYNNFLLLEPRISMKYGFNDFSSVKVSYNRTTQFIQLISNSISPFTTLEVWLPSGPNIHPQKSDIAVLGYYRTLREYGVDVSAELYGKIMYNQIDYSEHPYMLLNPFIESEIRIGETKTYGIDIQLTKGFGKLTGWLGYTYSRVKSVTPGVNNGNVYPALGDRPHDFSVMVNYQVSSRITAGLSWIYTSGTPITTPTSFYYYQGYTLPLYEQKNNDRLPDYHRMDIKLTYDFSKPEKRFSSRLSLTVFNVYSRKNAFTINFNKIYAQNNELVIPADHYPPEQVTMSKISMMGIIPAINYSFSYR